MRKLTGILNSGAYAECLGTSHQGVLSTKTATAGTKPCKKYVYILPLNVAAV